MSGQVIATTSSVPRLAAHTRLRFDAIRNSWTIQAPERVFMLDEIAHQIVSRCDGEMSVGAIVDDLCKVYSDAPRDAIERDVMKLVRDFVDKGVMAQ
jgi:pyrroloquinoline quinone biosynthesis protein D